MSEQQRQAPKLDTARKPRISYSAFLALRHPPSLFIYGEAPDFSNGWVYHHWTLPRGADAPSALWGM